MSDRLPGCRWPRRHVWEIVARWEQPSPIELMNATGSDVDAGLDFATRPVIVHQRCSRCGAEDVIRV